MSFRRNPTRRGAAVVEAAVALPLVFIVILGTVEVCNLIFLKQSLSLMAFEGARVAIIPDASLDDVRQQVEELGDVRRVAVDSVEVLPADFATQPSGTVIEVKVTSAAVQPGHTRWFNRGTSTVSVFIMKEQE